MNDQVKRYVNSSKYPIRFDRLHPGSLFKIVKEPSRGIHHSRDHRVYRKASEHEGFYSTLEGDTSVCAILFPEDIVQPLVVDKGKPRAK